MWCFRNKQTIACEFIYIKADNFRLRRNRLLYGQSQNFVQVAGKLTQSLGKNHGCGYF